MGESVDPRLLRLLGGAALAHLRQRLRKRLERDDDSGTFRLNNLNEVESNALAGLLGRPARRAGSMGLDINEFDAALLHAGIAPSLRHALEQLDGPIVNHAAERAALLGQWEHLCAKYDEPRLAAWLVQSGISLVKRLGRNPDEAAPLLDAAQAVLNELPAAGVPRSRLAADILGDAHGLDPGRPVASLVLAALRHGANSTEAPNSDAADESVRAVWAGAGVLVNELSRPALFLNLPVSAEHAACMTPGEPGYRSLRALLRNPLRWKVTGRDIHVCENPNLVAILADALGANCAPLVCTDGMPGAAQRTLLLQLAQAGAHLHYHGDFDWAGLAIGNQIMRVCGARPWRFGAADYLSAVRNLPVRGRSLGEDCVEAEWDAALAQAMRTHGQAVDEEAIAAELIQDMACLPLPS